ncbi:MAG: hypothetical protein ACRDBQ_03430 [Shewanella sp.]
MTESKRKGLPDEPFGQHLAGFSAAVIVRLCRITTQHGRCLA